MSSLTFQQKQAIDPHQTIWVTASAGSGKTKVLTDRLLTLMLSGTPPERLLCLTFTKAAAAEMANRLQRRLRQWATLSEALLKEEMEALGLPTSPDILKRARQLFSKLLDTPGGFKIQTLHGFCQSLLSRFPLEAGLSPHFTILDEIETHSLLKKAQDTVFREADLGKDPIVSQALAALVKQFSEHTLRSLMSDYLKQGSSLSFLAKDPEEAHKAFLSLGHFLKIPPSSEASQKFWMCPLPLRNLLEKASVSLKEGSATDQENAEILRNWLHTPEEKTFEKYVSIFLTTTQSPRKRLASTALLKQFPSLEDVLKAEQERLLELTDLLKRQRVFEVSKALLHLTLAIHRTYQQLKAERAFLDYDDLITSTIGLLHSPQGALWVLYKLDNGLDHVLIDEAQDTSPDQWRVIQGIVDAFLETPDSTKTLFVVGDPKQSIYSFQGADPAAFSFMLTYIQQRLQALQRPFREICLDTSFRSAAAILETVDQVFREGAPLAGVAKEPLHHQASQNLQGTIEIWPLMELPSAEEGTWEENAPKENRPLSPQICLTQGIARTIRKWLQEGENLTHKPLRPGDILILVRRRGHLMQALVKSLKEANIPVAGVDRMSLGDSLAVKDLLKIAEFCLLPSDDLTLAVVLKGPFFRFSEEALFKLAFKREPVSLWGRLREAASSLGSPFREAYDLLKNLQDQHASHTPFSFFSLLLNSLEGRRQMGERLGLDALEALDELISLSLAYEQNHPPVLQTFLSWMHQNPIQIKRDFEQGTRDEVRILTVHGSKGLEAPVVILPDTVHPPRDLPSFVWIQEREKNFPCWIPPEIQTPHCLKEIKAQEERQQLEEYNRLLYVALTRASERLYICGWKGEKTLSEASWYSHIQKAVSQSPSFEPFPFQGEDAWIGEGWKHTSAPSPKTLKPPEMDTLQQALPFWVKKFPPFEKSPIVLTPSLTLTSDASVSRGKIIHLLLEKLASLLDEEREERGKDLLKTQGEKNDYLPEVLNLLRAPHLSWLWEAKGLSEVAVMGQVNQQIISGRLDRLVITPQQVRIIDFKTDRTPPSVIPPSYTRQLFLYKKVLNSLYKQPIICGILWTQTASIAWLESDQSLPF